ncbi:MAG TPA: acyltransferase [Acidobacteriaceae bacterium]|jgi:peptidoglycan/LPS O-acetylase OafA/YrhL|nr:acyltransferase [Acidobacteriaceae bacterium]
MPSTRRRFQPIDFKTRFPALDGIRALAVTMVFVDHFGGGAHGGPFLRGFNVVRQRGWAGVDLFFVLSGFLITGILFDTRHDSRFFKRFFARRSLRIFPVFYLTAAVLLALTPIFHYQWRWFHLAFLVYMGNMFGNHDFTLYEVISANHPTAKVFLGHLWSLCVEEQFYLLWPLAVWLVRDRVKLIWTATGLSGLSLALRALMFWKFSSEIAERWIVRTLPFRMDTLLFGAILALLLRGPAADTWQRRCKWMFVGAGASVATIFVVSPAYDSPWLLTIGLTLTAAASAGLIGITLRPGSPAFQMFYFKPFRVLGKYSYGFYIFHVLYGWAWIRFLVFMFGKTHSLVTAGVVEVTTNFAVTFLISKLSYDFYEVRFLRFKKHFEYDSEIADHKHAFTTK